MNGYKQTKQGPAISELSKALDEDRSGTLVPLRDFSREVDGVGLVPGMRADAVEYRYTGCGTATITFEFFQPCKIQ